MKGAIWIKLPCLELCGKGQVWRGCQAMLWKLKRITTFRVHLVTLPLLNLRITWSKGFIFSYQHWHSMKRHETGNYIVHIHLKSTTINGKTYRLQSNKLSRTWHQNTSTCPGLRHNIYSTIYRLILSTSQNDHHFLIVVLLFTLCTIIYKI